MERLRLIREKRNVTQIRLSTAIGVTQETISAYESGKTNPKADVLVRIADFLNTSTDYLLGRINDDSPLNQLPTDFIDKQLEELLNNYAKLTEYQKDELIWFSDAVQSKDKH